MKTIYKLKLQDFIPLVGVFFYQNRQFKRARYLPSPYNKYYAVSLGLMIWGGITGGALIYMILCYYLTKIG